MRLSPKGEKVYIWLAYTAIAIGIIIRIVVYLQNRNLMIDEANVARNIYERGFEELLSPLSYEQYAPPLWLWAVEASSQLLGMGEQALRLMPLLSGIASLILLYLILKQLNLLKSAWYALTLLATGYIFIRYSTELKQYMSDAAIALALIWLALRVQIESIKPIKLFCIWLLAGSIAIWLSMPSVFVLAGVGAYYLLLYKQHGLLKKSAPVVFAIMCWIAQFTLYYWFILREQANSAYLQNFHKDYFLSATPFTIKELEHNTSLLGQVLGETAGFLSLAKKMHVVFICLSAIILLRKKKAVFLLLVLPLLLVLIAAAINQFTLIPRVVIFMMPVLLLLIAYGVNEVLQIKYKTIQVAVLVCCIICAYWNSNFKVLYGLKTEPLTYCLHFAQQQGIQKGGQLYIHAGAYPAFIYYTTIHPNKNDWASIKNSNHLEWNTDYNNIATKATTPCAFIFTSIYPQDLANNLFSLRKHLTPIDSMIAENATVYIYTH